MNDENFDLNRFIDMFDKAMSSDNPTVKKCFNNLLLVVAIAHAEEDVDNTKGNKIGPLRELVMKVDELERRLLKIEYINQVNMQPPQSPFTQTWTTTTGGNGYVQPNSEPYSISSTHSGYSTKFN